jgi:hypothetical protein
MQSILVVDDGENLRDTIAFKLDQKSFSITTPPRPHLV